MESTGNFKYIATIAGHKGTSGSMQLTDLDRNISDIIPGTIVKIGFSLQFSRDYKVIEWKKNRAGAETRLEGISDPEEADTLKEKGMFIDLDSLKNIQSMAYFDDDIVGCDAFDNETGEKIGVIREVWSMPANDVWVIHDGEKEILIPAVEEVLIKVDLKKRRVFLKLIEGLTD